MEADFRYWDASSGALRAPGRDAAASLSPALPDWQPSPAAGGLHQLVLLPGGTDEPALLAAAARGRRTEDAVESLRSSADRTDAHWCVDRAWRRLAS